MKEDEIRKRDVFNQYLKMVAQDVAAYFDFTIFSRGICPACGSPDYNFEFEKIGFTYVSCPSCQTLYVNPRPPFSALDAFYTSSPSTSYWVKSFFMPVAEIRREKIFRPRAEYIGNLIDAHATMTIGDIGAGFGLFLEELRKIRPKHRYIAIEPSHEMTTICQNKGLEVCCCSLEEMTSFFGSFDLLTAFELFEHLYDPSGFLKKAHSLLKEGGYLFLTTLNGRGFDILTLWDKSKSIAPPHHLNFFNPSSITKLLMHEGFEIVEASTPGKLDWDIVEGMIRYDNVDAGRFWKLLAEVGSDDAKRQLQNWISENKLSSHMRILAKKL